MLKVLILLAGGFGLSVGADTNLISQKETKDSSTAGAQEHSEINGGIFQAPGMQNRLREEAEEICTDIFRGKYARESCELLFPDVLSPDKLLEMETAYNILKSPNEENLKSLSLAGLEILFGIDSRPLKRALNHYTRREERTFITYLAGNPAVTQMIWDDVHGTGDYDFAHILFINTGGLKYSPSNNNLSYLNHDNLSLFIHQTLQWDTKPGNNAEVAYRWINSFFEETCHGESLCVLKNYYCRLSLNKDQETDLMETDEMESVLNEVLRKHRPADTAPHWWTEKTRALDLDSYKSEPHNICAVLSLNL